MLFRGALAGAVVGQDGLVDLAGEVSLEAANDVAFGQALGCAPSDVLVAAVERVGVDRLPAVEVCAHH